MSNTPMTSRERVARTLRFQTPDRLPRDFPEPYGTDFMSIDMSPSPDIRPSSGVDEWGAVWENIGVSRLGEVKDYPLKDWAQLDQLHVPDINAPHRWAHLEGIRESAGDKFILAGGVSMYERLHFIRGLTNMWMDIYDEPEQLGGLIDILAQQNVDAIKRFAALGADGLIFCDDWGLQSQLMIAPRMWRDLWKPRYARVFQAAHEAGLFTFLHSCGYIVDILDDLIEIGLDAVHMDQQENMGLELLGSRFGGRLTFFAPVDIQKTMIYGSLDEVRAYCRKMVSLLGRPEGGFIPRWYTDPAGAGHKREKIEAMCEEFIRLS
jgi:uroporphyrinogen decarboxylase